MWPLFSFHASFQGPPIRTHPKPCRSVVAWPDGLIEELFMAYVKWIEKQQVLPLPRWLTSCNWGKESRETVAELLIGALPLLTDELKPITYPWNWWIYLPTFTIKINHSCRYKYAILSNCAGDSTCWNCFGCSRSHGGEGPRSTFWWVLKRVVTALTCIIHMFPWFFFRRKHILSPILNSDSGLSVCGSIVF